MKYIATRDLTPTLDFRHKHCGVGAGSRLNIVRRGRVFELSEKEFKKYANFFEPYDPKKKSLVTKEAKK